MPRFHVHAVLAVAFSFLANLQAQEADAALPGLTWEQLAARPELWPQTVQINKAGRIAGVDVAPGVDYEVTELDASSLTFLLPGKDASAKVRPTECNALETVNAAFAAMTPEERALDVKAIAARADLWPAKVALAHRVAYGNSQTVVRADRGYELDFGVFDGKWVRVSDPRGQQFPALPLHTTDLAARVRQALRDERKSEGHRVLAELNGKLVNLASGKKTKVDAKRPPENVLLFFSAGWCAPCQKFSPQLVELFSKHKRDAGKRFVVIWVSRDRDEAGMKAYAKQHEFPFLGVAWKELGEIPLTMAHKGSGIPHLLLLDAKGAVVADSFDGEDYKGPASVLDVLAKRLEQKR